MLSSRRSERFLCPPADHNKPNDPRQHEDIAGQDGERVGFREALGTEHPALREIGEDRTGPSGSRALSAASPSRPPRCREG